EQLEGVAEGAHLRDEAGVGTKKGGVKILTREQLGESPRALVEARERISQRTQGNGALRRSGVEAEAGVPAGERGGKGIEVVVGNIVAGGDEFEDGATVPGRPTPGLEPLAADGDEPFFGDAAAAGEETLAEERVGRRALDRRRRELLKSGAR